MLKVKNVTKVGRHKVYDISVEFAEHYVLENGVVTHNTGGIYSANQIFIITKAQEKDGTDLLGYNFTINVEKSRFVREKAKFTFTVLYDGGIQKYSGLMDIALDGGFVIKPSNGWYSVVDPDTGEVGNKLRLAQTATDEFWKPILDNTKFKEYVKHKFGVSHAKLVEDTVSEDQNEFEISLEE